ncbi:ABC transporter permease [Zongyangia hominis]|uniref:ABC transporter permease n=1 Tax=Zongyangia hominis TaxID=2763677 RepID=A0A926E822_9FIRM|nr:ABC transporter permease [Zongyangia hominis]MBC8569585.1 ABC transporter permease [Zongyangia hominis]
MFDLMIASVKNLSRKKFRSFLTILAICISVASFVLISTIGNVGKDAIETELSGLGIDGVSILPENKDTAKLGDAQLQEIKSYEGVSSAVPIVMQYSSIQIGPEPTQSLIWGIDAGAKQVISLTPIHGRLINRFDIATSANVCVVDESVAQASYHRSNIVGKKVKLNIGGSWESFEVVGVVSSGGNILQGMVGNYIPSFLYVPYSSLSRLTGKASFDRIAIKVQEDYDADAVGDELVAVLNQQTDTTGTYKSENISQQKEQLSNLLSIITGVLSVIAGISLVVAGLGIMTVMMSSVTERTREIGIKKAIGASRRNIMIEFLIETMTISLLGSLIGTAVGLGVAMMGCFLVGMDLVVRPELILTCIGFSVGIGVVFGVYPASKAANLKPVEALRNE